MQDRFRSGLEHYPDRSEYRPRLHRPFLSLRDAAHHVLVMAIMFFLAVLISGIARGDQSVLAKPGRLKKLETKLEGKKVLWRVLGDVDLIDDSSGRFATFLAPQPGVYPVMVISAKGDEPLVELITVKVEGDQPKPPPVPPDPGPNPPVPPPTPKAERGILVVIEETANASERRAAFFNSQDLLKLTKNKLKAWRVIDKDVVNREGRPPADLKPYLDAAAGKQLPWFFLVDEKGRLLIDGHVPDSPIDMSNVINDHLK